MTKHRKFNTRRLFDAFQNHEDELKQLFEFHRVPPPDPFTTQTARDTVRNAGPGVTDELVAALYEINDLSTRAGRSCVESAAILEGFEAPGGDVNNQRAACRLSLQSATAFKHAIDLLAARAVRGAKVALFPGRAAVPVEDIERGIARIGEILGEELPDKENAENYEIRHYVDGDMLVVLVFCERTAQVQMDFTGPGRSLRSTVRRPVNQEVLLYDQGTGELEIDGGRPGHREILRSAFARAFFDDDSFFPREESARVLNLSAIIGSGFSLPVSDGHTARITGIKFKGRQFSQEFGLDFKAGRADAIAIMRARGWLEGARGLDVDSLRIELVLERTRAGRKVIELSGRNAIRFTRESFADEVHRYLRLWGLMLGNELARQSAA